MLLNDDRQIYYSIRLCFFNSEVRPLEKHLSASAWQEPLGKDVASARDSSTSDPSPRAGQGSIVDSFGWAAACWDAVVQFIGGREHLRDSLWCGPIQVSTHCSGIGAPEAALLQLQASSPVTVSVNCLAASDVSPDCQRRLLSRLPSSSHIFGNIFAHFPGYEAIVREPDETVKLLRASFDAFAMLPCARHGHCNHPEPEGDICGSPCQPYSKMGKQLSALVVFLLEYTWLQIHNNIYRFFFWANQAPESMSTNLFRGLEDPRSLPFFAWLVWVVKMGLPWAIHENVNTFP